MFHSNSRKGFSLMEILLSLSILAVGIGGILVLFPVGIDHTRRAINKTNAAIVASAVYDSLRASARTATPGGKFALYVLGEKIGDFPVSHDLTASDLPVGKSFGIPSPTSLSDYKDGTDSYVQKLTDANFRRYGPDKNPLDPNHINYDPAGAFYDGHDYLKQYDYNIQLSRHKDSEGKHFYDVVIRVRRSGILVQKFYGKLFLPTEY